MTTPEKCEAVLRKFIQQAQDCQVVTLSDDFDSGSVTVGVAGSHTHVGFPGATWDQLIDSLYGNVCEGRGLSWAGGDK